MKPKVRILVAILILLFVSVHSGNHPCNKLKKGVDKCLQNGYRPKFIDDDCSITGDSDSLLVKDEKRCRLIEKQAVNKCNLQCIAGNHGNDASQITIDGYLTENQVNMAI